MAVMIKIFRGKKDELRDDIHDVYPSDIFDLNSIL